MTGLRAVRRVGGVALERAHRFDPPRLDPASVALGNRLIGRIGPVWTVGAQRVSMRFVPAAPVPEACAIEWEMSCEQGALRVPWALLLALAPAFPDRSAPDPAAAALILEAVLETALDAVEDWLGEAVAVCRVTRGGAGASLPGHAEIGVRVTAAGVDHRCALRLGPCAAQAICRALAHCPPDHPPPDLPIAVAVRAGVARIGGSELLSLRSGDAILMEHTLLDGHLVALVAGEGQAATARRGVAGLVMEAPFRSAGGAALEAWTVRRDELEEESRMLDGSDVEVTLVFELGRFRATLAELGELAAGHVLAFDRDEAAPVDILANGTCVGHGEIVKVGDAWAVRVTRLARDG